MTEHNRPRHSQESAPDPDHSSTTRGSSYPGDGYDAAYAYPGPETAAAAGAAGAAGTPPVTSGPPLRGLAMILTAVAVILILWGAFSFFSGDEDGAGDGDTVGAGTSATGVAPGTGGTPGDNPGAATPGDPAPSDASPVPPAPGVDGGAVSNSPVVDKATARVTVLNNSTTAIAQPTADRLRGSGWSGVGFGNLQGKIEGVSDASRVYYPAGDAAAKAAAEQVAGELGLQAVEGDANYYDRFGEAVVREGGRPDGGVVVVLIDPLP